jgi:hypothetical protein
MTDGQSTGIIERDVRELIEDVLTRLDMVNWDRFVNGTDPNTVGRYINVYGWIERVDEYKDFVLLRFMLDYDPTLIAFTTSSDQYTDEIYRLIYREEPDQHVSCKRVEYGFDIPNAIELNRSVDADTDPSAGGSAK